MFPRVKNPYFSTVATFIATASYLAHAQGLPSLQSTNLGVFTVSSQMSVTNNDPGVNSSYTIMGGGNELWGDVDHGEFAWFPTTGDFDIRVRVESLQPVHRYAKTGLMVREGLGTTSRMVSLFSTPTGPTVLPPDTPAGSDNVEFNFRRALADGKNSANLGPPGYPNAWLRLARRGSVFYGMIGQDGVNWTTNGMVDTATWPGGAFKANTLLGLGASSHDDTVTVQSELRQFSPVSSVGAVQVIQQPVDTLGLLGHPVTFSVLLNDPVDSKYQWYTNNVAITGATNITYTTANLTAAYSGEIFKVSATGPGGSTTSSNATLTVVAINPPANPIAVYDFDDGQVPDGTAVYGTALVDPAAGYGGSGGLILTTNLNNQNGSFVIDDLNPGSAVDSFTVAFKMKIGPGSSNPADGVSLSFGTDIPDGTFTAPQQGVGPGLAVSFDIYDNGNNEAPAIDIFYGVDPSMVPQNLMGNIVHKPFTKAQMVNSRYVDVVLHMGSDGKVDLAYDGIVMAYHVQTGYTPTTGGRFGFGAYCGGQNAQQYIDDISIETTTVGNGAYLQSIAPLGNAVPASPTIVAQLVDVVTLVDTNSIHLSFNNSPVAPSITQDSGVTTVQYAVSGLLAPNSTNTVTLVWSDNGTPVATHTNTATFKVENYATLPTSIALPLGSGNANDSGFKVRIYQIDGTLDTSSQAAENALAGKLGDNIATPGGTDTNGFVMDPTLTSVINYDVNPNSAGTSITFPGIPGMTGSKENFAAEILTYLQFPTAGYYQMDVLSDDGFKLTAGAPGSANPLVVGSFEGARNALETIFGFQVPQAGVYPFRLLYYQGGGGASLKWSTVAADGTQVLVNDPNDPTAIHAFRSAGSGGIENLPVKITFQRSGSDVVFTWPGSGTLESTGDLKTWNPVPKGQSPYHVTASGTQFYRVRQ
jgi:hypothetical protein